MNHKLERLLKLPRGIFAAADSHFNTRHLPFLHEGRKNFSMTSMLKAIGGAITSTILEKPKFKVIENSVEGIEERQYEEAKWVSTSIQSIEYKAAVQTGFQRLFKYITGANDKGIKIDMTAPVATKIVPGAGPNCESTFTISFYIPPAHQKDPPAPTNPDVFVDTWPSLTVWVKSFGGFAKENDWLEQAEKLTEIVNKSKEKEKFNKNFWFTAGYNSPFQLVGRTNEVWFVKDPK